MLWKRVKCPLIYPTFTAIRIRPFNIQNCPSCYISYSHPPLSTDPNIPGIFFAQSLRTTFNITVLYLIQDIDNTVGFYLKKLVASGVHLPVRTHHNPSLSSGQLLTHRSAADTCAPDIHDYGRGVPDGSAGVPIPVLWVPPVLVQRVGGTPPVR